MPMTRISCCAGIVGLLLLAGPAGVLAKLTPEQKCVDAKAKALGDAVYAATQCFAKSLADQTDPDPECLAKVEAKIYQAFAKAEAKGACGVAVDEAAARIGACFMEFPDPKDGGPTCISKKFAAMGTKVRAKVGCFRKIAIKGPAVGAECFAKLEAKFVAAILKAEKKSACAGTAEELEARVDACVGLLPLPRGCGDSLSPICDGSCPDGTTCQAYEVFDDGGSVEAGCSCVDAVNGPPCGGDVCGADLRCPEPGFVCEQWLTGGPLDCHHSICQPAMTTPTTMPPGPPESATLCGDFPTCGGPCPEGLRCQTIEAFFQGEAIFGGCLCVDPAAPRCEGAPDQCNIDVMPFSHCADPSLTCLVTVEVTEDGQRQFCTEAHCGPVVPTTTSTSVTTTSTTSSTSTSTTVSTTSTSTSTSTSTTTLPCVSTPGVSGNFEDLGDCTVVDHGTGLQWEQKQEVPGPHHVNNRYVWSGCCGDECRTQCQPNAAAEATCLAMAEVSTDGCTDACPDGGGCYVERGGLAITTVFDWVNQLNAENFAGHNDWRVPTEAGFNPTGTHELSSILENPCTGDLCIDPIFGPTIQSGYWSRTTDAARSLDAWFVSFFDGGVANLIKREPFSARAVRTADPD